MTLIEFTIKTFTSIFIIMGPFSVIPVFISLTQSDTKEEVDKIIKKAIGCTVVICLLFAFVGTYFFKIFGISINSFRIAGGLLLLLMAISMLHARRSKIRVTAVEQREGIEKEDVSIFPLAIPLIAGPGAISTIVLLTSEANTFIHWPIIIVSILVSNALMYLILKLSERFYKILGDTGINILTRIMGLILASIAVEYILHGTKSFFSF